MDQGHVRFAVVGVGHIGARHVAMVQAHPEASLVAVADPKFAEAPSGIATLDDQGCAFGSLDAMLEHQRDNLDVVAICTPNGSHAHLAIQALEAGCHVVLEKPVALTAEDVIRVQHTAQSKGLKVFGVMQNRYAPAAEWLHGAMQKGLVGDVLQVHVRCLWNRDERYYQPGSWRGTLAQDGGPLFTQFSHFLDILIWVFGRLQVEDAHFVNQAHQQSTEFEDGGTVRFALQGGAWGTLTFSTAVAHQNLESSMTVLGSDGSFRIGGQYMDRLESFAVPGEEEPVIAPPAPANDYGGYKGSAANHHHVYDNVLDALLRGAPIATPIEEGLMVVEAIEAMHALGRRSDHR
ncbi:MAG TPA: oxidoreductase [Flavobacteriales bacterium]|nr:oxidoreductase [Flavobacteriales bacterium]